MQSIIEILNAYGGTDYLLQKGKFKARIHPVGFLEIRAIKNSPNGLPAVSIALLDPNFSPMKRAEMHLEITDLGWSPFYVRNDYSNFAESIYQLNDSGKVISVRHNLKRVFIQVAESWDKQIRVYGIENFMLNKRGII